VQVAVSVSKEYEYFCRIYTERFCSEFGEQHTSRTGMEVLALVGVTE
jgi:hypothetical protein